MSQAGNLWKENLKESGYQHFCRDQNQFNRVRKLSAMWQMVVKKIDLKTGSTVFEVGTGGGNHVVKLQLNGFTCSGVDVSPEVIDRSKVFIDQVAKFDTTVNNISISEGDFLDKDEVSHLGSDYDLVFDSGVIEHFLADDVRHEFLARKFALTKPGGWVVTIVPSGIHPGRKELRKNGWGGYAVPEIDYSPEKMIQEHESVGADQIEVIPYNVFGYKNAMPASTIVKTIYKAANLATRVAPSAVPGPIARRHAFSYVAIARKPI